MAVCGRPTASRTSCQNPLLPMMPACRHHLTPEERSDVPAALDVALALPEMPELIEPACWSWPIPAWPSGSVDAVQDALWFVRFHSGRCALCGVTSGRQVEDHDHRTGLTRGMLCWSCNVREGASTSTALDLYRKRHPTVILGIMLPYTGYGWEDGVPVGGWPRETDRWIDNPIMKTGI